MQIEDINGGYPNEATYKAANKILEHFVGHSSIALSLSGGADSDIMLDLIERVIRTNPDLIGKDKINYHYVFFDTGLELAATKRHIDELEVKYGIKIDRRKPKVPLPLAVKKYGYPFHSKIAAENINNLQRHGFFFTVDKAETGNKGGDRWWNYTTYPSAQAVELKTFMLDTPPTFSISAKCCKYVKKDTAKAYYREIDADMVLLGMRKVEGGSRAINIKSCFVDGKGKRIDKFLPIWWFSDADKSAYKAFYGLRYSDAYEVYGFKRTGCAGCPFNSRFDEDLAVLDKYEPKLAAACRKIFAPSYEYTRQYREFKSKPLGQISFEEVEECKEK